MHSVVLQEYLDFCAVKICKNEMIKNTPKDGRPPQALAAWRALQADREFREAFPQLGELLDQIPFAELSLVEIKQLYRKSLDQLGQIPPNQADLGDGASIEKQRLEAAQLLTELARRHRILSHVSIAVMAELQATEVDQAAAEDALLNLLLRSDPTPAYMRALVTRLSAAGVTARSVRNLDASKIVQIAEIINSPKGSALSNPQSKPAESQVSTIVQVGSLWGDVLKSSSCYKYADCTELREQRIKDLIEGGFPPYLDLESYGDSDLVAAFNAAKMDFQRKDICLKICKNWVAKHNKKMSTRARDAMQETWPFLLGLRYGFANGIPDFKRVEIPSPFEPEVILVATKGL